MTLQNKSKTRRGMTCQDTCLISKKFKLKILAEKHDFEVKNETYSV